MKFNIVVKPIITCRKHRETIAKRLGVIDVEASDVYADQQATFVDWYRSHVSFLLPEILQLFLLPKVSNKEKFWSIFLIDS